MEITADSMTKLAYKVPNYDCGEQKQENGKQNNTGLHKRDAPSFGTAFFVEACFQFVPHLFRRALVEFGLIFLKKIEQIRHVAVVWFGCPF